MTEPDSIRLSPGILTDAATVTLAHEPLPPEQIVAGTPMTGTRVLDDSDGVEIGVWEMTAGTATDTEIDEVFIVVSGRATVVFDAVLDADPPPAIELTAGAVVRLTAGMRTTWIVHETLRKIYIA
ncbi:cupin domain-containing protein [soil metagenome]